MLGLITTATVEAQLAKYDADLWAAKKDSVLPDLSTQIASLNNALQQEPSTEDAYGARVCLQHCHFLQHEWATLCTKDDTIMGALPEGVTGQTSDPPPHLRVAILKSKIFTSIASEHEASPDVARKNYASALSYLESMPATVTALATPRLWAQHMLARYCAMEMQDASRSHTEQLTRALEICRVWSTLVEDRYSTSSLTDLELWSSYYTVLSLLISNPASHISDEHAIDNTANLELKPLRISEYSHVESMYESCILQAATFPHAHEDSIGIERWATRLMVNWHHLSRVIRTHNDLTDTTKSLLSRRVLDMLYRAAAKSFHSTVILRYLYQIHAHMADFDLAVAAFDSYAQIVDKKRARAAKTGKNELGLENANTIFYTTADCINLLCTYGDREQSEKVLDIAAILTSWLDDSAIATSTPIDDDKSTCGIARTAAIRALGQAKANRARHVYDPALRTAFYNEAIAHYRATTSGSNSSSLDVETAGQLALVLAEIRDVDGAISTLKDALSSEQNTHQEVDQRKLLPLWHHLVLLLSAREDFASALSTCRLALDIYKGATQGILIDGHKDDVNGSPRPNEGRPNPLEDDDRAHLIQLKLTEIDLVAVLESPSVAVVKAAEPLSLYARLFGVTTTLPATARRTQQPLSIAARKASHSTLRNIRNSILGRPKSSRGQINPEIFEPPTRTVSSDDTSELAGTAVEKTPDVASSENGDSILAHKGNLAHTTVGVGDTIRGPHGNGLHAKTALVLDRKENERMPSLTRKASITSANADSGLVRRTPSVKAPRRVFSLRSRKAAEISQASSPTGQRTMPVTAHDGIDDASLMCASASIPQISFAQRQRQHQALLAEIWLFIAGMYAREDSFDDVNDAIAEAAGLVEAICGQHFASSPRSDAFDVRGWGCGRSMGRLSADIWAEVRSMHSNLHIC